MVSVAMTVSPFLRERLTSAPPIPRAAPVIKTVRPDGRRNVSFVGWASEMRTKLKDELPSASSLLDFFSLATVECVSR